MMSAASNASVSGIASLSLTNATDWIELSVYS